MVGRRSTQASHVVRNVRDVVVVPWLPLATFLKGSHRGEHVHAQRSGTYVLGVFSKPPSKVDLADSRIIYIGQTNNPGVNLYVRLHAFARSAKLPSARGIFGHSGGLRFKKRVRLKGKVHVAIIPYVGGPHRHPDWRGISPGLVEKLLLATFLEHHHRQPILNEDGRHVVYDWEPSIAQGQLAAWTTQGFTRKTARPARAWLRAICELDREVTPRWHVEARWRGFRFCPRRRGWLVKMGQYGRGPVRLEVWVGDQRKIDVRLSRREVTMDAAYELQYRLRNGWLEDRY